MCSFGATCVRQKQEACLLRLGSHSTGSAGEQRDANMLNAVANGKVMQQ